MDGEGLSEKKRGSEEEGRGSEEWGEGERVLVVVWR